MRLPWLKLSAGLCLIWAAVAGLVHFARSSKATPESLANYIQKNPLEGLPQKSRDRLVEKVASQLNELTFEERRQARAGANLDKFVRTLTPAERERFLDLTLPTGFKQMMDALNRMPQEKRKELVAKALEQMQSHEGEGSPMRDGNIDASARKIIDEGFKAFYSEASAEVKLDVAPLIEQLQKNLQSFQGR